MREETVPRDNIFVVGCQRSGTSVVYASLIAHPELTPLKKYDPETGYDPKELYYFRNIFQARREFESPMYGWDVDRAYLRQIIETTVRFCAEHHGAASGRWVSALTLDGLHIPELIETMPKIRVVYVLRHPQEVVWSSLHAPWAVNESDSFKERVAQRSRHWSAFAKAARDVLDGRFGKSVLIIRHEDIIEHPEQAAENLARHVGLTTHCGMADQLRAPTFNSSFANDSNPKELVERTRRAIARAYDFRSAVVRMIGKEMEDLGYHDLGNPPLVP